MFQYNTIQQLWISWLQNNYCIFFLWIRIWLFSILILAITLCFSFLIMEFILFFWFRKKIFKKSSWYKKNSYWLQIWNKILPETPPNPKPETQGISFSVPDPWGMTNCHSPTIPQISEEWKLPGNWHPYMKLKVATCWLFVK